MYESVSPSACLQNPRQIRLTAQYLIIRITGSEGLILSISVGCSSRWMSFLPIMEMVLEIWSAKQVQNFCSISGIGLFMFFAFHVRGTSELVCPDPSHKPYHTAHQYPVQSGWQV